MKLLGVLLILTGLALIAQAAFFLHAPMEEPVNPGKTPNPSRVDEEIDRLERMIFLRAYVAPVAGLLMAAFGGWLLIPDRRRRD
jgi:hypothetical protein